MKPSIFQEKIYDFISNGKGHGIVQAVAGSGKTTTLIESLRLTSGSVIFLAFNKSIATELQKRAPSHVNCCTLHSAGLSIIKQSTSSIKIDAYKIDAIMDNYSQLAIYPGMKFEEKKERQESRKIVKSMISLVKNTLTDYNNANEMMNLANYYNIDLESYQLPYIKYVIEYSNNHQESIDFDDMIYLPVLDNMTPRYTYDFVFVDESQDMNRSQIELILKLAKPISGRIVAVGDAKQSIYGFRGADIKAMSRIQSVLNAVELPLSICYRCPKSHINLAKSIVPQIESKENAIDGTIIDIKAEKFVETLITENPINTLVISRTNAELVKYALKMIAKGHKAIIKGRDIGQGLISLINKLTKGSGSVDSLISKLNEWKNKEIAKLESRKASESLIQNVYDKVDTILAVIDDCDSVFCVTNKLDMLFNDQNNNGYIFSSIHRGKGLEADNVYILAPNKLPLVWKNQQSWELEQEMNIKYVAITRSKNKLVFVNEEKIN